MQKVLNLESCEFSIFGVRLHNLSMSDSVSLVVEQKRRDIPQVAYFVNANSINQAFKVSALKETLNNADYVFPDGAGVKFAARQVGVSLVDNVNGTDMLPHLCDAASLEGKSIYLLGGDEGVAEKCKEALQDRFPRLRIAGTHHGFLDQRNCEKVIADINNRDVDILLVGMGTPIQELWIEAHKKLLNVDMVVGVGGLFDFFSGRIARAPLFLREAGLEWIWRLLMEPKKKFFRYVIGNPLFVYRAMTKIEGI